MEFNTTTTPSGIQNLQFNPDQFSHATLKAFNEFIEQYKFRYEVQYPEPLKHAIEASITKWTATTKKEPRHTDMEAIKNTWISKDKIKKLLGSFATARLIQDWKAAEPNDVLSRDCTWDYFLQKLRSYHKPTENPIIQNFEFRQLVQAKNETFSPFSNRVEAAGKTCTFCEYDSDRSAEEYAIRDQIVPGTTNENICEKAMIKNWKLAELRQKGMKYDSAAAGEEKISGCKVNKVGVSSDQRIKNEKTKLSTKKSYRCSSLFSTKHIKDCKALKGKCSNCNKIGHFAKVRQQKNVNRVDNTEEQQDVTQEATEMETYQLNIWNIQLSNNLPKFTAVKNNFKKNLLAINHLVKILIDTGAKVSVCGEQQAKLLGIYDIMKPSVAKIHPYNSAPIKVTGTALCSASFKNQAVPVEFYILPGYATQF